MHSLVAAFLLLSASVVSAPSPTGAPQDPKPHAAITPAARTDAWILDRQAECVRRAKTASPTDVVFVGDSITQGWEGNGKEAWERTFTGFSTLNLGVSGDRTEHVLWRLQEAPLDRLQPKVVVLLIGTNNLGHGTSNAEQTLDGVLAVVRMLRAQAPQATLLVCETFPRGERINPMRGDILQVNQALRGQLDAKSKALPIGDRWVRKDGTIDKASMPDFLHLSAAAYQQWAEALLPEIRASLR
ncbi:MAG: GDSL family lipase [Planctomycetes bacterium]|nr:GDSL family lipase [Planctomycetota bacterium]